MIGDDRLKVIRIEIEDSAGEIRRALGDDADAIMRYWMACETMDWMHGGRYAGPTLEVIRPARPETAGEEGPS